MINTINQKSRTEYSRQHASPMLPRHVPPAHLLSECPTPQSLLLLPHRQLRSQLSLVVIAQMLDQEETLPLWQEKAQVSLGLSWAASPGPRKPVGEQRAPPEACLLLWLFPKVGSLRPGEASRV